LFKGRFLTAHVLTAPPEEIHQKGEREKVQE